MVRLESIKRRSGTRAFLDNRSKKGFKTKAHSHFLFSSLLRPRFSASFSLSLFSFPHSHKNTFLQKQQSIFQRPASSRNSQDGAMICDIFTRGVGHDRCRRHKGATQQKILYFSDDEMDCLPTPRDSKLARFRRRHPDRSDRRRSANADILESVGLPPTVSYNDMKALQEGLSIDDILGRRSSCSIRFKEAVSIVGGNATQAARRASKSATSVARWSKKMTPPIISTKLQKKALRQSYQSSTFHETVDSPHQFHEKNNLSRPQ